MTFNGVSNKVATNGFLMVSDPGKEFCVMKLSKYQIKVVLDPYFVRDVGHLKMSHPKYSDNQTIKPICNKELIKILMQMSSFIQNIDLGLLCLVLIIPKN